MEQHELFHSRRVKKQKETRSKEATWGGREGEGEVIRREQRGEERRGQTDIVRESVIISAET